MTFNSLWVVRAICSQEAIILRDAMATDPKRPMPMTRMTQLFDVFELDTATQRIQCVEFFFAEQGSLGDVVPLLSISHVFNGSEYTFRLAPLLLLLLLLLCSAFRNRTISAICIGYCSFRLATLICSWPCVARFSEGGIR